MVIILLTTIFCFKNLQFTNYHNMVLFPLESLLKGDMKDVKGVSTKLFT